MNAEDAERYYNRLGRTKGPDSRPAVRKEIRGWFVTNGEPAIYWLANRIRDEHWQEILHDVIVILTAYGDGAERIIAEALKIARTEEAVWALETSLREIHERRRQTETA